MRERTIFLSFLLVPTMSVCDIYGIEKIIQLHHLSQISVTDVYSDWKRWVVQEDNAKYDAAFRYVGGDPTLSGQRLGITYFLINNWKLRPSDDDQTLVMDGNIFTEDGSPIFISTVECHNVAIQLAFSNLTTIVDNQLIIPTPAQIAKEVWNTPTSASDNPSSFGNHILNKLLTVMKFVGLK